MVVPENEMVRTLCLMILWVGCGLPVFAQENGAVRPTLARYNVTLSETTSNGGSRPVRDFEIRTLVTSSGNQGPRVLYLFDETTDEQPWQEQFGQFEFDTEGHPTPDLPLQSHRHDGHRSWVRLWVGVYPQFQRLTAGAEWNAGTESFRVTGEKEVNSQECWLLEINAPQGRRTTLSIQKTDGAILSAQHRFFVGMGEKFDLNLKAEEITTADTAMVESWNRATGPFLQLKSQLQFDRDSDQELSVPQLQKVTNALDEIDAAADGTAFATLAGVIRREASTGLQRADAIKESAARHIGRAAPPISLTPLDGGPKIEWSTTQRPTVLHFWEYQEKPLSEPYGQIGYLDFLAQKWKDRIQVVGVISDQQLKSPATVPAALRSARKLREFMNVGYPLGYDDQGLLRALDDPRSFGVDLPLWVVVGGDGKILHYHIGFYEVDNNKGLEELDAVIEQALKGK